MRSHDFSGKTALIAGAGCDVGIALAHGFRGAGARVVLLDRDAARISDAAALAADRIETLALDPLRRDLCRKLGDIWGDEPLDILVHLQALRDPGKTGQVITGITGLTRDLARGLRAARGRVLTVHAAPPGLAEADQVLFDRMLSALPETLQARLGRHGVRVNALRLPGPADTAATHRDLVDLALFLCGPAGGAIGGALIPVWPRSH